MLVFEICQEEFGCLGHVTWGENPYRYKQSSFRGGKSHTEVNIRWHLLEIEESMNRMARALMAVFEHPNLIRRCKWGQECAKK